MKFARGLVALAVLAGSALEARAQIAVAPLPGPAFGVRSFGIGGISITRKRVSGAVIFGGYGVGVGPAYPGVGPFAGGASSITIVTQAQPPAMNPPVVISNPPPSIPPQGEMDLVNPLIFRPQPKQAQGDEAPLPGAPAGGFRPVRPEDRARAQQAVPPEGKAEEKAPPKERAPRQELKPKEEAARQMTLGKQAFAAQEYGRAAARFQEAIRVAPDEALAYFLLAQADLALGKYREATAAIHEGLRRKADWPASDFRPIELYGGNVADYTEHLDQLRQAQNQNPNDPVLLFLYAYQLWFDGRQDEARILFRKALPLVTEPRFLHLFLDGQGGVRVVFR
jgi:Tetratricopeptide repeat